jgi:hypothetical protein
LQLGQCVRELLPVRDVVLGDGRDSARELAQDPGEQAEIEVLVHRFAFVHGARMLQYQRNAASVETCLEPRRMPEGADIELVGIFQRDLCLVGNRLGYVSLIYVGLFWPGINSAALR